MNYEELCLGIAAACNAAGQRVIVVGSQAILGTYLEDQLPSSVTLSREMDAVPQVRFIGEATEEEIGESIARINVAVGEGSPFHAEHGFYVEGVDGTTIVLPDGWDRRLVRCEVSGPGGGLEHVGWCLDPDDICVSKALAGRPHDNDYVRDLIQSGMANAETIAERIQGVLHWGAHAPDRRAVDRAVSMVRHAAAD